MNTTDKKIGMVSVPGLYTTEEIKEINASFGQFDVEFISSERRLVQNSIFEGLQVIISSPLATMFLTAFVINPLYDLVKTFLSNLYKKIITKPLYLISGHKKKVPGINVHISLQNHAQIIMVFESEVPVNDQLLDKYFLKVRESMRTIEANQKKIIYMKDDHLVSEDETEYILYLSQQSHQNDNGESL
ncbi:hypothetical protein ACKP2L_07125 [Oenococcus alcoholitolerans]|uniref:hypothetical protein n=1 Tax=Oenococcus alcoholitolerans TaxID=931074 RepID=UPI003F7103D3